MPRWDATVHYDRGNIQSRHVVGWDATVHYDRGNTQSKCSHVMFRLCDCCYMWQELDVSPMQYNLVDYSGGTSQRDIK